MNTDHAATLRSWRDRLRVPVIGAPMFLVSGPALVIAQCTSGVIGTFPALNARSSAMLGEWLDEIRQALAAWDRDHPGAPAAPFGVNLTVHRSNVRLDDDLVQCVRHRVPLVISSMGARTEVNQAVRAYCGVTLHDVTTPTHARKAIEKGAVGLVAVAAGAGGHAGRLSPFALVQEIRAWFDGPLVLGGAIATGQGVAAARAMGADFAYVGSAFIATREAACSEAQKQGMVAASAEDIVYTDAFSGTPANYLRGSIVAAGLDPDNLPSNKRDLAVGQQHRATATWRDIWGCGQGVGAIEAVTSARGLVDRLAQEYRAAVQAATAEASAWRDAPASDGDLAHRRPDRSVPLLEGTVGDALRRAAVRFADRPALNWEDGEDIAAWTYRELLAEAEPVAHWLLQFGGAGDCVAIWSRNELEWILLEYGCALAGMVVCGWIPAWSDVECRHALELTTPVLLVAGQDTRGVSLLARAEQLGAAGRVIPLADVRGRARAAPPRSLPQVVASDLFLIQFTSGTTGRAKGAALSHRAALNSAWLRFRATGADATDVSVNPSPMSHMGGSVTMLLGNLVTGGCYVVMSRFEPGAFLRLMRRCGATRIGGVPTMLLGLLDHPDWVAGSVQVRSVGAGGAQVPQPLILRLLREFAAPVLVSYAQSECPMITSSLPSDAPALLAETVGACMPHVELKVIDAATGRTLRMGEVGELCVRGPIVMDGYYRMPEATAATIDADGFLHTGDLGALDAQGYIRFGGRSRDVIIRGGENIYPAEVEDALLAHPDVGAVAVVGIPDLRWGQQVGAAVLPRAGAAPTAAALEAHLAGRLAHFKVPRRWRFVEHFPMTASGKIRKLEVEALFEPASAEAVPA